MRVKKSTFEKLPFHTSPVFLHFQNFQSLQLPLKHACSVRIDANVLYEHHAQAMADEASIFRANFSIGLTHPHSVFLFKFLILILSPVCIDTHTVERLLLSCCT